MISDRLGTQNWIFGYLESAEWIIGLRQVEQGFSSFLCQIFGIFDGFAKFHSAFGMLHFEKSSNMAKIWQKTNKSASMVLRVPEPRGSSPRSATSMYDTSSQHWLTKTKIMSWHNLFNPCIFTSDAVKNLWEGLFRMLGVGLFFQSQTFPHRWKTL